MGCSCFKGAPAYQSVSVPLTKLSTSSISRKATKTEKLHELVKRGNDYYNQGNFRKAIDCHEKALQIADRLGDKIEEARAKGNIGNAYRSLGDFKKAIEYHNKELEIAERLKDEIEPLEYHNQDLEISENGRKAKEILIDAFGNRGTDYFCLGEFSEAMADHRREKHEAEGLKDAEGNVDKKLIGKANSRLGNDYYSIKKFVDGKECHEIHLKNASDRKEQGLAYGNIGIGFRKIGQFQKAKNCHEEELKIAKETRNKAGEANALLNLGSAYRGLRRFGDAKCFHRKGLKLAKKMSTKVVCGDTLYKLGRDFECKGSLEKAVKNYQRSVDFYKRGERFSERGR